MTIQGGIIVVFSGVDLVYFYKQILKAILKKVVQEHIKCMSLIFLTWRVIISHCSWLKYIKNEQEPANLEIIPIYIPTKWEEWGYECFVTDK